VEACLLSNGGGHSALVRRWHEYMKSGSPLVYDRHHQTFVLKVDVVIDLSLGGRQSGLDF
jgi:hypothetical protein